MAMQRAAALALRCLAGPRPALILAPLRQPPPASTGTSSSFFLQPATVGAAALCARRGFATDRKAAWPVSEDEDEEEYEAMGSDEELDGDFDDEELDGDLDDEGDD